MILSVLFFTIFLLGSSVSTFATNTPEDPPSSSPPSLISPSIADRILSRAQLEFALDSYKEFANSKDIGFDDPETSKNPFANLHVQDPEASKNPSNVLFSPFSVHVLLSLLYLGLGDSPTSGSLGSILHVQSLERRDFHFAYQRLLGRFADNGTQQAPTSVSLRSASAVFHDESLPVSALFAQSAWNHYGTPVIGLDFKNSGKDQVNRWVSQHTGGLIDRLPEEATNVDKVLLLVHALHLKALWLSPFDPKVTDMMGKFHVSSEVQVKVPLMIGKVQGGAFGRSPRLGCSVLELPFAGHRLALVAALPDDFDGLPELERKLVSKEEDASGVDALRHLLGTLRPGPVHVRMPRFRLKSNTDLKPVLSRMGARGLFDGKADFLPLTGEESHRYLAVDSATHSAVLEVTEEGAEGGAVTWVGVERIGMVQDDPRFEANHPFIFFVWDYQTRLVLFMGRITRPDQLLIL